MGRPLSRLGWRLAAPLCALLDRLYRRWHRLEGIGGIFHVGRETWRGAPLRLRDGTAVTPGDVIVRLHFDGTAAAAAGAGAESVAGAGLRLARRFVPACGALARRLRDDPGWADVVAVHAVTWISPYVGERWGFEAEPLAPGPRSRLIGWHMGILLAAAGAAQRQAGRPRPVAMWMSRRRLCERYLDEAAGS